MAFSPMVVAGCGSPRSASFYPTPRRHMPRQAAPLYRHDLSGSTRQHAPVVAASCASLQHCHADGPGHCGAGPIHHEHRALSKHQTWQRHRTSTGRCDDALCLPWCRTTRPVVASACSGTCSDADLPRVTPDSAAAVPRSQYSAAPGRPPESSAAALIP